MVPSVTLPEILNGVNECGGMFWLFEGAFMCIYFESGRIGSVLLDQILFGGMCGHVLPQLATELLGL